MHLEVINRMAKRLLRSATGAIICLCLAAIVLMPLACSQQSYSFDPPMALRQAPSSVTVEQISNDYKNDPIGANAKYLGKSLSFDSVVVENIHAVFFGGNVYSLTLDYFTSGNVSFQLFDFKDAQQRIQPGYILKLEGICQGISEGGYIRINDCWYQSIQGDMGTGAPRVGGY
jgi:hypothetical protein